MKKSFYDDITGRSCWRETDQKLALCLSEFLHKVRDDFYSDFPKLDSMAWTITLKEAASLF